VLHTCSGSVVRICSCTACKQPDAAAHWKSGPSTKPSAVTLTAAGRDRRSFVPEHRGQMTEPAPWQCAQVPVKISPHAFFTWLNAMEKDATYGPGREVAALISFSHLTAAQPQRRATLNRSQPG
jgi:hypothetical protein